MRWLLSFISNSDYNSLQSMCGCKQQIITGRSFAGRFFCSKTIAVVSHLLTYANKYDKNNKYGQNRRKAAAQS